MFRGSSLDAGTGNKDVSRVQLGLFWDFFFISDKNGGDWRLIRYNFVLRRFVTVVSCVPSQVLVAVIHDTRWKQGSRGSSVSTSTSLRVDDRVCGLVFRCKRGLLLKIRTGFMNHEASYSSVYELSV